MDTYICEDRRGVDSIVQCEATDSKIKAECESELKKLRVQYCNLSQGQKAEISDFMFNQTRVTGISKRVSCIFWA
jgi:hypothetical protein